MIIPNKIRMIKPNFLQITKVGKPPSNNLKTKKKNTPRYWKTVPAPKGLRPGDIRMLRLTSLLKNRPCSKGIATLELIGTWPWIDWKTVPAPKGLRPIDLEDVVNIDTLKNRPCSKGIATSHSVCCVIFFAIEKPSLLQRDCDRFRYIYLDSVMI